LFLLALSHDIFALKPQSAFDMETWTSNSDGKLPIIYGLGCPTHESPKTPTSQCKQNKQTMQLQAQSKAQPQNKCVR
jgi:hypothetical protein